MDIQEVKWNLIEYSTNLVTEKILQIFKAAAPPCLADSLLGGAQSFAIKANSAE